MGDTANFWNDNEVKTHIQEYVRLLALDSAKANDYFTTYLYKPLADLCEVVWTKYKDRFRYLPDIEDFKQICMVRLLACLPTYDPTRGNKALTYFWTIVKRDAFNMQRQSFIRANVRDSLSLDNELVGTIPAPLNETSLDLTDKLAFFRNYWTPDRLTTHFRSKSLKAASYLVGLVSAGQGLGLSENMAKGFHSRSIADKLNVSHQTVSNCANTLAKLTAKAWAKRGN